ncbi:MAG: helix-turn-helix transcriptional regulator [Acidimicrobiales bacterium]
METNNRKRAIEGPVHIETAASIGDAIRRYRAQAGLTQEQLSRRTGIRRVYLSEMESGKETEQIKRLLTVLHELGVTVTFEKIEWPLGGLVNLDELRALVH